MSKWKRILIWVGIIVFVGGVYLWLFGVQTTSALMVRYQFRKLSGVAKTPVPLTDLSISSVQHRAASYFGYEFELPSDDVDEEKDKTFGTVHVSYFRSGNAFWFSTSPPKNFVNEVTKTGNLNPQDLKQLYGEDALESDYTFHKKMLELTAFRNNAIHFSKAGHIRTSASPDKGNFYAQRGVRHFLDSDRGFQRISIREPADAPIKNHSRVVLQRWRHSRYIHAEGWSPCDFSGRN